MVAAKTTWAVLRALAFLSRIPVGSRPFADIGADYRPADDAQFYPLCGVIIALPGAVILFVGDSFDWPALLTALLALLATMMLTGALHEDGLADMADGFGGGRDADHRLTIMKDHAIGTYGALVLAMAILLQAAALESLGSAAPLSFIAVHALSRAFMVAHWTSLPLARAGGTAGRAGTPTAHSRNMAVFGGVVFFAVVAGYAFQWTLAASFAMGMGACMFFLFNGVCRRLIGGHTGDTIGATQMLTSIAASATLAIAA